MSSNILCIVSILKEFDQRLEAFKREEEVYNFTDIARMAIQVVSENKDVLVELRDSFQEILVDEYQDTSDTQEKFISLISKNNVYMVGDIKQSIYRFRNANPYIFKNKYDKYSKLDGGIKIDLLDRFITQHASIQENLMLAVRQCLMMQYGERDDTRKRIYNAWFSETKKHLLS